MCEPLAARYSLFTAVKKLMEDWELERLGDRLSAKKGYKIVIFGHTHKTKIDKDSVFVADRIYANTGCWSQKKDHCVIVDVNADEKATVNPCKVKNSGRAVRVEKEKI
jgi:UDP-2,3-diacylglucosamine pyrophosphatase LpxH